MTDVEWLIDKSALVRVASSPDAPAWSARAQRGLLRVSAPTLLEVGYSAVSSSEWDAMHVDPPLSLLPIEHLTPQSERRAVEVQGLLATRGQHRAPSVPDLLIAAVAESTRLTVLHVDTDFELIAEITGQPVERLRT